MNKLRKKLKVVPKEKMPKNKVIKIIVRMPTILETEKFILDTVRGQDEQVRQIVNAEYKSINYQIKSNVLIVGKSGTGKTEILRQLAKKTGKACITVDANDYTEEAYKGANVSDIVLQLLRETNFDFDRAENGIVIIDEIDKKAKPLDSFSRDVSGKGVQDALLKLIEGKSIPISMFRVDSQVPEVYYINTENIMFFFAGAFSGIDKIIKNRLRQSYKMGFSAETKSEKQVQEERKIQKADLIKFGLEEEFVGRIDTIVQLNDLSEEVLVDILKNSKKSRLKTYLHCLKSDGITVKYNENCIKNFAKKAQKDGKETGAREISNVINYVFDQIMYQVMSKPQGTYKELILQEGIEEDNTKYILR